MLSTVEMSELLLDLYAAPLQPERWQMFLERLCVLMQSKMGVFVTSDSRGNYTLAGGGLDYDPEPVRLYNTHYGSQDPWAEPCFEHGYPDVLEGEALVRRDALVSTEFYNAVLAPFDLEHVTITPCLMTPERKDIISLWRNARQGPLDEGSFHFLQSLLPHMQNALRLHHKLDAGKAKSHFLEVALHQISTAAFLISKSGRVLYMNRGAEAAVQSGGCLALKNGHLRAFNHDENVRLDVVLAQAIGRGPVPGSAGAMQISRALKPPLHLVALPFLAEGGFGGDSPAVVVFLNDPSACPKSRGELLKMLWGLTATEARLADLLLEGLETREAAERMSITIETARFHLKRVLAKTGARRQSELVRLMLSLPGQ